MATHYVCREEVKAYRCWWSVGSLVFNLAQGDNQGVSAMHIQVESSCLS